MNIRLYFLILLILCFYNPVKSQKTYSSTVFELIFSGSMTDFSDEFTNAYADAELSRSNIRFTLFFNLEKDWHYDFSNNIGVITGFGIRNIGLSTNEVLPTGIGETTTEEYKIVRRAYTLGIPLMLKAGSFKDRMFVYAGGEYELVLHYKEKYWEGSQNRSGRKTKYTEWLGAQTPRFLPSVVGGIQLPGGINIKLKYYLSNFLNRDYSEQPASGDYNISDLSRYENSNIGYISITWQFTSEYLKSKDWKNDSEIASR